MTEKSSENVQIEGMSEAEEAETSNLPKQDPINFRPFVLGENVNTPYEDHLATEIAATQEGAGWVRGQIMEIIGSLNDYRQYFEQLNDRGLQADENILLAYQHLLLDLKETTALYRQLDNSVYADEIQLQGMNFKNPAIDRQHYDKKNREEHLN